LLRKKTVFLCANIILTALFIASINTVTVKSWSNGGFSTDPANPDYGTHDWIAEHALDWLPQQEKQFLLDNKAAYLYGTELPDNNQAPDGIGDTTKHHVYFAADGSVQDDAAAIRARDEYTLALNYYRNGNETEAAKHLGATAHYVADMAVFGHVMGASTVWGAESHHSDYEDHVQDNTNSYSAAFNTFLVFDSSLSTKTAYDAAVAVANDTTFDAGGQYTCVWMDTHYNWSDAAFKNRSGESLNLAVNTVANVLHTFSIDAPVIPEFQTGAILSLIIIVTMFAVTMRKKTAEALI
jgi:hypothetical protein